MAPERLRARAWRALSLILPAALFAALPAHAGLQIRQHRTVIGQEAQGFGALQTDRVAQADDHHTADSARSAQCVEHPLDHGPPGNLKQRLGLALGVGVQRFARLGDAPGGDDGVNSWHGKSQFSMHNSQD